MKGVQTEYYGDGMCSSGLYDLAMLCRQGGKARAFKGST